MIRKALYLLILLPFLYSCTSENCNCEDESYIPDEVVDIDIDRIKDRGTLNALTAYSSTSYFIYRGQPMGYEYELLTRLADYLEVDLELTVADDLDSIFYKLNHGEVDIIAHGITITKERKDKVAFTEPHNTTRQVLVQRKPENWRELKLHEIEKELIRNPVNLIGKTINVRKNSSYYQRLQNLSEEIGGDIHIAPVPGNVTTDEIIRKVALGEYDYTVADQNLAFINKTYYPELDVKTNISLPTRLAWAVRKTSPELLRVVNEWLKDIKKKPEFYVIYDRYFKNERSFHVRVKSDFYSKTGNKISTFDDLFRDYAEELEWDWRLLASQIYQESQFDPNSVSWAGAKGLMQVMPATGRQFGVEQLFDPDKNIKYINYLNNYWKVIPDSTERIKFVLASYNVGPGHVEDARRLAEKYGKNPFLWDDHVAEYLLLKSKPHYYNDDVVKYGFCRGREPYYYVKDILARFKHYSRFIEKSTDEYQIAYKE